MSRLTPFIIQTRKTNMFFSFFENIPQLHILQSVLEEKNIHSLTGKTREDLLIEYNFMMQTFAILLVHKINIEHQMIRCFKISSLDNCRNSLREWHASEEVYLEQMKKDHAQLIRLSIMMPPEESKPFTRKFLKKIDDPLAGLRDFPIETQNASLAVTAEQIVLGESYKKLNDYLAKIVLRSSLVFKKLVDEKLQDAKFLTRLDSTSKILLGSFEECCRQAASNCNQKKYSTALLHYANAAFILLNSSFAPLFDFDHTTWQATLVILNINLAKVLYYLEEADRQEEFILFPPQWNIASTSALIFKDKEQLVKMQNWGRPKMLNRFLGSSSLFSTKKFPSPLLDLINEYATETKDDFTFPSESPEAAETIKNAVNKTLNIR